LGIGEGDGDFAGRELRLLECAGDDPVADLVGDAVPDALRLWFAVFERVEAAGRIAAKPSVGGGLGDADLVEGAPNRQEWGLDRSHDVEPFGGEVSHSPSSPSEITLFLSRRFSCVPSARASLSCR